MIRWSIRAREFAAECRVYENAAKNVFTHEIIGGRVDGIDPVTERVEKGFVGYRRLKEFRIVVAQR